MRIRSHLDPTLFVIFLHINAREYDDAFRSMARSLEAKKGTSLQTLFSALSEREHRIFAHERYHFWQGLRLPFVHLNAALTLRLAYHGMRKLARISEDWHRWAALAPRVPSFNRIDKSFYIAGDRSGKLLFGSKPVPDTNSSLRFTAKDMLECATSIFDYQSSCEMVTQMSDPEYFKRWCKRRPAYVSIYRFLAEFLDSERLALRTILPLINAAFHTSVPERAMAELIARIWGNFAQPTEMSKNFLSQNEPCRWPELFRLWLTKLDYNSHSGPEGSLDLDSGEFYYLDPERWLGAPLLGGNLQHPFLGPLATEWARRAKEVPSLESYLDLPGYVSNEAAREFAFSSEPQLRVVRIFMEDGSDKVFAIGDGLVGPAFADPFFSTLSESDFRGFILDLMAAYGAFRRAIGENMSEAARTCYQVHCTHYEVNYCNSYPLVPERHEDCGFPERMREFVEVHRRIT